MTSQKTVFAMFPLLLSAKNIVQCDTHSQLPVNLAKSRALNTSEEVLRIITWQSSQ